MAKTSHTIILALVLTTLSISANTRPLTTHTTTVGPPSLAARLKLKDGDSTTCWDSLFELQSCTGEIILFFINGETYLGKSCCKAIENIEKQCWPNLMGSLGFTSEEGDILRGFCDAYSSSGGGDVPAATPPPQTANATIRD